MIQLRAVRFNVHQHVPEQMSWGLEGRAEVRSDDSRTIVEKAIYIPCNTHLGA
jgi:hypothetical protein